jgi:ligand-binding SRPBCC domain-containing protein
MKIYHLYQKQFLPISLSEAWDFFSTPKNLVKITPPNMDFDILHISGNGSAMYPGQIISYRIKLFHMFPLRWVTEITHVHKPFYFVDDQRFGPYAFWHHQHRFNAVEGGVEMIDEISYGVPFGIFGRMANRIFVARQLKTIFRFRHHIIEKTFLPKQMQTQSV